MFLFLQKTCSPPTAMLLMRCYSASPPPETWLLLLLRSWGIASFAKGRVGEVKAKAAGCIAWCTIALIAVAIHFCETAGVPSWTNELQESRGAAISIKSMQKPMQIQYRSSTQAYRPHHLCSTVAGAQVRPHQHEVHAKAYAHTVPKFPRMTSMLSGGCQAPETPPAPT